MTFSRPGAIDLSALKQPAGQPPQPSTGAYVVEVDEQNFQSAAVEPSMSHVVVLSLWSPRSPQSLTFNANLASIVDSYSGQILVASINIDVSPAIGQAVQAQGVPVLVGLIKGQPVPLIQGTADDAQVRQIFDELVKVAAQEGLTGRVGPAAPAATEEPAVEPDDPRFAAADAAFAEGNLPQAVAEYEKLRAQYPADAEIAERLAGVKMMARTQGADLNRARQAASDAPDDIEAQFLVADLDVTGGHIQDALDRLIELIKRTSGDDREAVRERLLELFLIIGVADSRVSAARRALATALF